MALPLALALALAAPPCGLPPLAGEWPWPAGETLSYDVAVMGMVKAGTLQLAAERPMLEGSQVPLKARVRTTSIFAKIRRVKGVALSWVDARSLRPQRYRDDVEQDGVRRTTDTRFDRGGPTVKMSWTSGPQKGVAEFERKQEVLDALSAIYLLRAAELRPGSELCFDLLANRRYWRFRGAVAREIEQVETEAGSFRTVRIDARVVRADDASQSRPLHLWFSTDPRHLLVAVVSEVDLGPVQAMLSRAPPGS